MKYIDLTYTFTSNMPVYPGDSVPELVQTATQDNISHFHLSSGMHVGTHMDAPLHMIVGGKELSQYPVDKFFGRGHLVDVRSVVYERGLIAGDFLDSHDIQKGDFVLLFTGFGEKFGQAVYYEGYPEISEDFSRRLVDLGVNIVGMDTPSPDRAPYLVHKILLSNDVLIVENLCNLEQLLNQQNFEIIALPSKFQAEAAFARVVAKIL